MQLKTSWYKHEMMKQNFRQVGWISLIYCLALFFAVPLNMFMQINQPDRYEYFYYVESIFEFGIIAQILMLFIVPVLMGMFILRYLHQKDASDFLHSLPISRTKFFWQQAGFGLIALWLPIMINGGLIFLINRLFDVSDIFRLMDLGYWLLISIILITFIYSVSLILGVLTGITIIQGIFTYIFLYLPVGFTFLFVYNLNFAVVGLPESHFISDRIFELSPISDFEIFVGSFGDVSSRIVMYLILIVFFLVLAQILYKIRPAEAATQAIAFQMLKPIFIYSFTFCFTLIGGLYFGLFQQDYLGILIGYLLFSIIGYFISQMIVHKTWRVFREWRDYGFFFIGFTILIIFIVTDLTGFQSRIPDLEEVESVFVIDDVYSFNYDSDMYGELEGFTNAEDIELVRDYHQSLIDNVEREAAFDHNNYPIEIIYRLENGKELVREYNIPWSEVNVGVLRELRQRPIYKKYTNALFMIDPAMVNQIQFTTYPSYKSAVITDRSQIVELIELFKQDILDSDENFYNSGTSVEISLINQDYHNVFLDLNRKHKRVIEWLKENELEHQAMIVAEDIESILIARPDNIEEIDYYGPDNYPIHMIPESQRIEITDRNLIEETFEQISFDYYDGDYLLVLYLKEMREPYIIQTTESLLPKQILEQL
ncbi:DUF6449 domain-containing protein [Amphibacillus sp. Q70]|uniref:DUF6449 domain-containing protein n=1 Tax=Amphibacillus sp. Q70 TaxID=3453416 RepID=UPI003F84EA73